MYIYQVVSENGIKYYNDVPEMMKDYKLKGWNENPKHRAELQDQPLFFGLYGCMYGGTKEGKTIIRYETKIIYDSTSN